MLDFDLLKAPPTDGDVLIEPPAAQWPPMIERVMQSQATDQAGLKLAGIPVEVVRRQTRDRLFGTSAETPVIACGHQPEFVHPGVWAKHVVVRHMADRLRIHGVDIVVDNDSPHSTAMIVPQESPVLACRAGNQPGLLTQHHVSILSSTTGVAYEGQPPLNNDTIEQILCSIEGCLPPALCINPRNSNGGDQVNQPLIADYCHGLSLADQPTDFVDQHLAGRWYVDRQFNADLHALRVSQTFDGPFVADILIDLGRFARAYNESLAEYRIEHRVRGLDRPLPDLKTSGDKVEAPFWIYQPRQLRSRLWVAARGDALDLFADDRAAGTLSQADLQRDPAGTLASLQPWLIRPRALTLTLWARLLTCDLFIHGIGGAKYDRLTDGIFRRYYHCQPPGYACVSATLRLPLHRYPVTTADFAEARRRVRDVRFNPQRYISALPADLLVERQRLIDLSKLLHRQRGSRIDRQNTFNAIHQINAKLCEPDPQAALRAEQDLNLTREQLLSNALADSREYFYALQPRGRLAALVGRLIDGANAGQSHLKRR